MMNSLKLFYLLIFLAYSDAYKILLYSPKLGHSHVNFMSQITKLLVDAGHEVIVLSSKVDDTFKDPYHQEGKIYYTEIDPEISQLITSKEHLDRMWKVSSNFVNQEKAYRTFMKVKRYMGKTLLEDEKLKKFIMSQNFDAAIAESKYVFMFGLFKYWKIETTIVASSTVVYDSFYTMFGIPFPASYLPSIVHGVSDRMTYIERANNLFSYFYVQYISEYNSKYSNLEDIFDEKFGIGFYDSKKIMTNASFVLINSNPFLDIPAPKSPKMIDISGIGIPKSKPVTNEFDAILNKKNKTILISFGSVVKSAYMNKEMKTEILKTIKSFPDITFIWKYETPEDGHGAGIENLILRKWVPQNDLLNDERLTLFITHGGMGSTTEVAFSNVPALIVPIFGDQMRNAKVLERMEIGLAVEKEILTDSNKFREKISEVLNDKKYKINSLKTAEMLRNRPVSPEQLLIKHVEFACKFGQLPQLNLASTHMGIIEYYNIDVFLPLVAICVFVIYGIIKISSKVILKLFLNKKKQD